MKYFMAKKRWVAILLTIVMLTTCLSPVHNALIHVAAAEETAAAEAVSSVANVDAAIEPNIVSSSDVSAEAVSASVQTSDNTSAVGNPSAAGKESAAISEPAPVSEPATPAAEEPVPASSSAETSTANTVSEPSNATQSSPVSPVAPAADETPVSAEEPVLEKEVSVSTNKSAAASESSTPTDAPAEPSAPSISIDVPAEASKPSIPTETPAETSEPSAPTEAPAETSEPSAPTETPAETSEPSAPTEAPAETSEPSAPTEAPAETSKPSAPTEAPAETSEPFAPTDAPAETSEPSIPTEAPAETSEPSAPTETPAETSEPSAPTEAPAETSEPSDPAEAPAETVEPSAEPSITPEVTSEPTPAPAIPALNVSISMGPSYLMAGSGSLSATASFSGGAGDYQVTMRIYSPYSLENEKTVVMSEPGSLSLGCTPVHGGKHNAVIYVTDAAGQTAEAIATTSVSTGFPESPSVWADSVSRVQLTGVWNEDIIAIAQSQLGNREYESCFMVDEGGKPHYYTRYGHWFGSPYQDWCAMFVAFCLHHAGISTNDYPVSAGCTTWKNILTERDVYEKNPLRWLAECETEEEAQALWDAAYTPVSGDLVFFNRDGGEDPCHVGIVEYVEDGLLHTIEGNADNAVMRLVYDLTDETIAGYANTTVLAERAGALLEEDLPVTALPENTIGYTVIKSVNLRSMPTINSDQLAQLSQPGTAVTVLNAVEGNTLWYQVDYEGIVGYIRGDLLALEEPAETEAPEVTPEITPEPTVEPAYFCGLEVHIHDELCSDADGNITCEITVHEHDDSCLIAPEATPEPTVEPVYYCGLEVHVHDELCSNADGNIICELTVHEHDDSCLIAPEATPEPTVEPVYFCGLEVHVHDELCSDADGNITCELTVHEHDDSCLIAPEATPEPTVEPTYFCGLEVHVHDELCSDADGNITCELTVHEHDDSCLIAPEPTVEPVYYCGLEVHVHDELCSDADGNIICELTVHEHDDSCLIAPEAAPEPTVEPTYFCGLEVHVHDELCSDADGNITCELTVHEHDDSCLIAPEATPEPTVEPVYYCGLEVHVHDELCSDADGNIICELTVHEHDDSCLIAPEATPEPTVEPVYYCDLEVHIHDELCSDTEGNIICELTVHEHDDSCLIAPEATPEPTAEPVYYCGLEVHIHDELCSDADGNIICELTVHEHDDSCLIAPEATPEPTVEPIYFCGLEVHIHDELCSDADGNIICELTVHEHDETCLITPEATPEPTIEPTYFCGLEVHIHDELCSDADGNIICELTVHEHNDSCLIAPEATPEPTVEPTYYCGLEVHVHDELCSDADGNIICELTVHEHDETCLIAPEATPEPTVEPVYFCGLEVHVHDELCSDADGNIICELTVHEHDETCLSPAALQLALTWDPLSAFAGETLVTLQAQVTGGVAPYAVQFSYAAPQEATAVLARSIEEPAESPAPTTVAASGETATFTYQPAASGTHTLAVTVTDAMGTQTQSAFSLQVAQPLQHETEADFLAAIAPAQLTGDARADIVAIAATQLGYTASATDFVVDDTGAQHAYTRYGAWAQQPYAPWSAPFVQFCLHYAGLPQTPAADAAALAQQMAAAAQYRAADAYVPLKGDVVFFDWDEDGLADHTGLVANAYEGENGYTIETIEGDVDGAVITRMFVVDGMPSIIGFGQTGENKKQAFIDLLVKKLDALPTYEEVEAQLTALEDDMEAYEAYYLDLHTKVFAAYVHYQEIDPIYQCYITNQNKLHDLSWMLASTMNLTDAGPSVTVNFHNYFNWSGSHIAPVIVYGGSVDEMLSDSENYKYWYAYVIEMNSSGFLYVSEVNTDEVSKRSMEAKTPDGFVLLIHDSTVYDISVGDYVNVNFNYKSPGSTYNANGFGQLLFYDWDDHEADLDIVTGANTRDLIEVNLYDYGSNANALFNEYGNLYPAFQQDSGTLSMSSLTRWNQNFGNNITTDLAAGLSGITDDDANAGTINHTPDANSYLSGLLENTLINGYPQLKSGASLKYLFTDNSGYATKKNSQSINGLFQYHEDTGAYTFNSRENHAQFNASNDTFTLYEQMISSNFIMYPFGNFLPFNNIKTQATHAAKIDRDYFLAVADRAANAGTTEHSTLSTVLTTYVQLMDEKCESTNWGAQQALKTYFELNEIPPEAALPKLDKIYSIDYDNATNFFFGMDMKMTFMQPKGGLTGLDGKQPMEFHFTGDDDVWVFIDDQLFLDLSGIHRHVAGDIDFVKGEVRYYNLSKETGEATLLSKTVPFSELVADSSMLNSSGTFKDYTSHTFNFYYMERGAGSGVCRMNFNFPLLKKNSISVAKELTVDDTDKASLLGNPDFKFQVFKENGTDLFIGPNTEYTVYNTANQPIGTGKTDANGVFTLKAGQRAEFGGIAENSGKYFVRELLDPVTFEQYGKVTVGGSTYTIFDDVTVGTATTFKGVDSPVKDASDGTTLFNFNNNLEFNKLGKLEIAKVLLGEALESRTEYDFEVALDGNPLPVGTKYTVGGTTKTVQTEGIVSIAPGTTAVFENVIAGTQYSVKETTLSAGLHSVSYRVTANDPNFEPQYVDGNVGVSGTVGVDTAVTVTCTNAGIYALPETGGHGTLSLYTVGGLLILASASCLLYKQFKRRREGSTA